LRLIIKNQDMPQPNFKTVLKKVNAVFHEIQRFLSKNRNCTIKNCEHEYTWIGNGNCLTYSVEKSEKNKSAHVIYFNFKALKQMSRAVGHGT